MSERRFLQLLKGAEGPAPEDYRRAGVEPLRPEEARALAAEEPMPPTSEEQTLVGVAELVFAWGFVQLSEWMKGWAAQQTVLHTWGRAVVPAGERLHLWMGQADDRADLWFNNESLNHKNLGEEGTWSITGGRVKKGANVLVAGVNNSGRGRFGVQVIAQRGSDNARIDQACLDIQGDEGPFTGRRHLYFIQLIGAAPRGASAAPEGEFQAQEVVSIIVGSLVTAAVGWGLNVLGEWMKTWADQDTLLHSLDHAYLPAGDQLQIWLGHADDQASLWFNNENINHKALGDAGNWMIPTSRVRKGPNLLVLAIDNIGHGHFGAEVVTRRASTGQNIPEMCISLHGDEGPFVGNKHLIYVNIIGR